MKKIILFILLSIATYGQIVPTGQEQDFDYGIRNTASQLDDNAVFLTVQDATGVQGKSTSSVWAKKIYVDNADAKKQFLSTGLLKNGLLQANVNTTLFDITAGTGIISNFDNPDASTSNVIIFPSFTGILSPYLTTSNITYVAINSVPAVVMQASPFTDSQRRDLIILGAIVHSNLATINTINNISAPANADTNQLHDLMEAIGALNISGNKYSANGANLSLNKSAGDIFKLGINFANNWKDPHKLTIDAQTLLTLRYRTQNGTEGTDVTVLNPAVYDLNNVLTAVPSNRFSIQTVTLFQSGITRVQYGQNTYATMAEAEAAINTRSFAVESNIALNGIARAYIILKNSATSLQNASDAKIVEAQKFGGSTSGGVALTNASIIAALGYTPENVANKSGTLTASSTLYPNNNAVIAGTILNQNSSAQSANMRIGGLGTFGSSSFGPVLRAYNPTLSSVDNISIAVGVAPSEYNSGFLVWQNASDPSNRYLSLETYASLSPLRINSSNFNVSTSGSATFTSTVSATSFNGSAALTGTPTAPTAPPGTNTTQIANMAALQAADASSVKLTGNQSITGDKRFNSTVSVINPLNSDQAIILENGALKMSTFDLESQAILKASLLTTARNFEFPDASGTIALVETVKPYKVYTALLSQTGTNAPTAIIQENTLGGTVTWSRVGNGSYRATLTGAFVLDKTTAQITGNNTSVILAAYRTSDDIVAVNTQTLDDSITKGTIEIRVYN